MRRLLLVLLSVGFLTSLARSQHWRVSLTKFRGEADGDSFDASVSDSGRYVAFSSDATDLVSGDVNGLTDIFVKDRATGLVTLASVSSAGVQANDNSGHIKGPQISGDGSVVVFTSDATNLVAGVTTQQVYLHDLRTSTTELVSLGMVGQIPNKTSRHPSVSADGRYVAFITSADNLGGRDTNDDVDVYVRDRTLATTERASLAWDGTEASSGSFWPELSPEGRHVLFSCLSSMHPIDTNFHGDVYLRDLDARTTQLISQRGGMAGDDNSGPRDLSSNGEYAVFITQAINLVPGDRNGSKNDVLRCTVADGSLEVISVDNQGLPSSSSAKRPSVSDDGQRIVFYTASGLDPADLDGDQDIYLRDLNTGTTTLVSGTASGDCDEPEITGDGRQVVFESDSLLEPGDTNGARDIYMQGPWLTLEAESNNLAAGDRFEFFLYRGQARKLHMLAVTAVNRIPLFQPVFLTKFDIFGLWSTTGITPAGLAGNQVTLIGLGFAPDLKIDLSNTLDVNLQ